jgi:hypothetical protein
MKKITFLFILISGFMFSQEFSINNYDLNYIKIIDIPNKGKNEIYKGIKSFLNSSAKNSKYFIDTDNLEIGLISYNEKTEMFPISEFFTLSATYKVTIDIKDNKLRYSVNNFSFVENVSLTGTEIKHNYENYISNLENNESIEKLEKNINSEVKEKKRNQLILELAKLKAEKQLKKDAIENIKKIIINNPDLYLKEINKVNSDW